MNKILVVLFILLSSLAHSASIVDEIDSRIGNGQDRFELTTPKASANKAVAHCIRMGYYNEIRGDENNITITVDATVLGRRKQGRVMEAANGYADDMLYTYLNCSRVEDMYLFGFYREDIYTGNLFYGCGESFIEDMKEKIRSGNARYGSFPFMNVFGSIVVSLKVKGYRVVITKEEGAIFFGKLAPVGEEI